MAANVPTTVVDISSPDQFSGLLKSSKVVVTFCKLVPHLPLGLFSADCPSVARTNILQHMFLVLISSQSLRILLQDCYAHRFTQYLRSFPAFIRAQIASPLSKYTLGYKRKSGRNMQSPQYLPSPYLRMETRSKKSRAPT
jgi:hypothetical protein